METAASEATCVIDGCGEAVVARGWCRRHYNRARSGDGTFAAEPKSPSRACLGCDEQTKTFSWWCDRCRATIDADERRRRYRAWHFQQNRDRIIKRRRSRPRDKQGARATSLRAIYGVESNEFDAMHRACEGRCQICGYKEPTGAEGNKRLHVDHDHTTGRVRGLLCFRCNTALGHFRDDPALLKSALNYLETT